MDISVVSGSEILPYLAFVGVALLVAEFLLPTKGFLGIIGAFLFVFGTITLTTHPDPDIRISIGACVLLNVIVLGTTATLFYLTYKGYTAHKTKEFDDLTGKIAHVVDWNTNHKRVELDGAIWIAATRNDIALKHGQSVRVISQDNLTLVVEPTGDNS